MSTKELHDHIIASMKSWQKVEDASVASTGTVMEKTGNPVIRLIMEIIQQDSRMHRRVQELIADSLEKKAVTLNPDELAQVWGMIEEHIQMEQKTIHFAGVALKAIGGKKMVVQEYLLNYLLEDEKKHDKLLETLSMIKKGMYPYG